MKKKFTKTDKVILVLLSAFIMISNSFNPPNGYTGAPPSGNTCSAAQNGCHSGGPGTGNVLISVLPSSITPSTAYPISVTVNRTNSFPQLAGFQMTVLNASNNPVGTFSGAGPNSAIEGNFFEHRPAQSFGSGNSVTYTVTWTSPATGSGTITMYAAALLANGNSNTSGDPVVTTNVSGTLTPGPITVNFNSTNVSCFGGNNGSATALPSGGGGGPYFYSWSNGATNQTINNLVAATYHVTVTNTHGASGTGSVTITQPPMLTLNLVGQTNVNCVNPMGSATVQASGGTGSYTYTWSTGASGSVAALPAGTHTASVTDANNCLATKLVSIHADTVPPLADAGPDTTLTCLVTSIQLDGTGSSTGTGITYSWTTNDGNILSGANTATPLVNQAGTYCLTVTNTDNGCTASDCTLVTYQASLPQIVQLDISQPDTCAHPFGNIEITATGIGAMEYSVDNGQNWSISHVFTSLPHGIYHIKVRYQANPSCETSYSSNPVWLQVPGCCPTYANDCQNGFFTDDFIFGTFSNTGTGCSHPGPTNYADYSGSGPVVQAGETYPVTIKAGPQTLYAALWIDFDQDTDYETTEFFPLGWVAAHSTLTTNIVLPNDAKQGTTGLRVRGSATTLSASDGCNSHLNDGETEQYSIFIFCPNYLAINQNPIDDGVYKADIEITSAGRVPAGGFVDFMAEMSIVLQPGFEVEQGGVFQVILQGCFP